MNPWKEIFGACAGPLSGFILLLSAHWLPKLAVCAFFQTILNLLPIREFDGGRILNCVFSVLFGKSVADRISTVLELVLLITTMSVGLYISTHNKTAGLLSVITALLLMHRSMEKLLAKPVNK